VNRKPHTHRVTVVQYGPRYVSGSILGVGYNIYLGSHVQCPLKLRNRVMTILEMVSTSSYKHSVK
jgi:hypothetical protein